MRGRVASASGTTLACEGVSPLQIRPGGRCRATPLLGRLGQRGALLRPRGACRSSGSAQAPLGLGPGARALREPAPAGADRHWWGLGTQPQEGPWAAEPLRAEHLRPTWWAGPAWPRTWPRPACWAPPLLWRPWAWGPSLVNGSSGSHLAAPRRTSGGRPVLLARLPSCLQGGEAGALGRAVAPGGRWGCRALAGLVQPPQAES